MLVGNLSMKYEWQQVSSGLQSISLLSIITFLNNALIWMVSILPPIFNSCSQFFLKPLIGWFVGFYGISTFVGYLTPNPFLCK